jgi:hypothetical protein
VIVFICEVAISGGMNYFELKELIAPSLVDVPYFISSVCLSSIDIESVYFVWFSSIVLCCL